MNSRLEMEQIIIAAIIYYDEYASVASILQKRNFSNPTFIKIFAAASVLYPTRPINLITLNIELSTLHPEEEVTAVRAQMQWLGKNSVGKSHLRYICLLILQIDIKESFQKELLHWRDIREREEQLMESAILTEMLAELESPTLDILILIEKAIKYFDMHDMTLEYHDATNFNNEIGKKASGIKRTVTLDTALSHAYKLAENGSEIRDTCDKFISAINTMIITNKVKPSYIQAAEFL